MKSVNTKICLISLVAMLCVVIWHCFLGSGVEHWFIPVFCTWSVPWFFFVSGVFWAASIQKKTIGCLAKEKFHSLVLPYLAWCVIGAFFIGIRSFNNVWEVFAMDRAMISPPNNNALWYARALMVFCLISCPLLYATRGSSRRRMVGVVVFLVSVIALHRWVFSISTGSAPFYFATGVLLSGEVLHPRPVSMWVRRAVLVCALLGVLVAKALYFAEGYDAYRPGGTVIANVSYVLIIIAIWMSADLFSNRIRADGLVVKCWSLTAFVYFAHFPILRAMVPYIRRGAKMLCIGDDVLFLLLLVAAPLFFMGMAAFVKRYAPRCYGFLSGGR